MKDREKKVVEILNKKSQQVFKLCENEFEHYDAYSDKYIVEIKCRNAVYDTKIIEAVKLFNNLHIANSKDKIFLYVVSEPEGMYVFNMSKIARTGKLPMLEAMVMPDKTEFGETKRMIKYIYQLDFWSAAKYYRY
jgi:hypothetical protein